MIITLLAQANPPGVPMSTLFWLGVITLGVIALLGGIFVTKYFNLWIQAMMTHANISIMDLVGMSFRKVNPNIIVRSKIMAYQAGLSEKDGVTTKTWSRLPGRGERAERRAGVDRRQSG